MAVDELSCMLDNSVETISVDGNGCERLLVRIDCMGLFNVLIRPSRIVSCDERV